MEAMTRRTLLTSILALPVFRRYRLKAEPLKPLHSTVAEWADENRIRRSIEPLKLEELEAAQECIVMKNRLDAMIASFISRESLLKEAGYPDEPDFGLAVNPSAE